MAQIARSKFCVLWWQNRHGDFADANEAAESYRVCERLWMQRGADLTRWGARATKPRLAHLAKSWALVSEEDAQSRNFSMLCH
jgi:hypothetical protein